MNKLNIHTMIRKIYTLFALILFTNIFAQTTGPVNLSTTWTNASGNQSSTLYAYVPSSYNSSNTYSLIIGFPGQGWSYQEWGQSDLPSETGELREYMDSYYGNVIVVSPTAPSWPNSLDPFDPSNYYLDYGIIEAVKQKMDEDYNIGDVYVQGFSVGGRIAVHQAVYSTDAVKGLIAHSPAVCDETIEYANATGLLGCITAYDQLTFDGDGNINGGGSPGCYGPPGALEKLFWWIAQDIVDNINDNNGDAIWIENANFGHAAPNQTQINQCWDHVSVPVASTTPVANFTANNTNISEGESVIFTDNSQEGGSAITAWSWNFTGGTPATSTSATPTVTYNTAGTYTVSLTVTNSYGPDTETKNGYITVSAMGDAFTLDFESSADYSENFAPWTTVDNDNKETYGSNDFDFAGEGTAFGFMAFNPADAAVATPIATTHNGDRCGMAISPNEKIDENTFYASDNWLISSKVSVSSSASYKLWVLTVNDTWGNESYNVLVSTTNNNLSSFSPIASNEEAPNVWTEKTYSLSSYAGQDIYIALQHTSTDKFMFFVDDIEITGATTAISKTNSETVSIYPNPAKDIITISNIANSNIEIVDINGKTVISDYANSNSYTIDISSLNKGTYFAKIINNKSIVVKKVVVD